MSDDLSAFFAKKKDKKKKAAVKIEDVGQALERRARKQEEYEQEQEQLNEKRGDDDKWGNAEESEWIEYGDNNQGRLEGLKIKDMGLEQDDAQENNDEPEDREVHETKTWGQINNEKKSTEETEKAVTISDKQMAAAYKPPARRYQPPTFNRQPVAKFDMNDSAFPSLADAVKIEKTKKDDAKSSVGWTKAGSADNRSSARPYSTTSGSGRESAIAAVKNLVASAPAPAAPRQPAPVVKSTPAAGSYVPPHLRNAC